MILRSTARFDPDRICLSVHFLGPPHPAAADWPDACAPPDFLDATKWDPRVERSIRALLRRTQAEVLHLGGMKSILLGRVAARGLGIPALVHFHDTQPVSAPVRWAQRALRPWTAGALAVSEASGQVAARRFGFEPGFVQTVYNGVELTLFQQPSAAAAAATRAACGWNTQHRVVAMVGRLRREKSAEVLLHCGARLRDTLPDLRLLFVGDGPARPELEQEAAAAGLADRVFFAGDRPDVPRWLAAADLLALPNLEGEGFPVAGIEALAAGKPVLGFHIGGLPELVRHGVEGWLAAPGDRDNLTEGLQRLLTDDALRARLSRAAAQRANVFTLEAHVRRLEAVYTQLAATHRAGCTP